LITENQKINHEGEIDFTTPYFFVLRQPLFDELLFNDIIFLYDHIPVLLNAL